MKSAKTQRRYKGKPDMRTSHDAHDYVKPFLGSPAMFHSVIQRMLLDAMWVPSLIPPADRGKTCRRTQRELTEYQDEAYSWLFSDNPRDVIGREDVCEYAGINLEFFEGCLPKLKEIVDEIQETRYYVDSHGEVKRPQEIANWTSKMLIRSSQDDKDWWELLDQ